MIYYRLNDYENRGVLVKAIEGKNFRYDKVRGWVRSGIMAQYFFPDSPVYESYEEITEEEANKLIEQM
ncbi:MAG: hypothetical protein ACERKZ_05730 [Lachnotalea sp.]